MAEHNDSIRLPELPVFKRYSLALRQEYASAEEILGILQRSSAKVEDILSKQADKQRREEEVLANVPEPTEQPGGSEDLSMLEESEDLPSDRPFWEDDSGEEDLLPLSEPPARARQKSVTRRTVDAGRRATPKSQPKLKAKTKPKHTVVRVGSHGDPIPRSRPSVKAAPKRSAAKPSQPKAAPAGRSSAKPAAVAKQKASPKPASRLTRTAVRPAARPKPKAKTRRR